MSGIEADLEVLISKVCAWVEERSGTAISPDLDLMEAGLLDSLGFVELIAFVEEATGLQLDLLEIEPEEFAKIQGLCRFALLKGSPL